VESKTYNFQALKVFEKDHSPEKVLEFELTDPAMSVSGDVVLITSIVPVK